jgi:uncharacterized repeat protein (TIGR03803 family)
MRDGLRGEAMRTRAAVVLLCALTLASCGSNSTTTPQVEPTSVAGPERVLFSFEGFGRGAYPHGPLLAFKGKLYGTTSNGGYIPENGNCHTSGGCGTLVVIDAGNGTEQILTRFTGANGAHPFAGLIAIGDKLYGTTVNGGKSIRCSQGCGTLFEFDTSTGTLSILHNFNSGTNSEDGAYPYGGVIAVGNELYGTTLQGGGGSCVQVGCGTVYAFDLVTKKEFVLYRFHDVGGAYPYSGLVAVGDLLYGTTTNGGKGCFPDGCGTVFQVDRETGAEKEIFEFDGDNGAYPHSTLISVGDRLWGTAEKGGSGSCTGGCGTAFAVDRVTSKPLEFYSFKGGEDDGAWPRAALVAKAGTLYGTTVHGGVRCPFVGCGTVFALTPATGAERLVYRFDGSPDGAYGYGGLIVFTNGKLVGTTVNGGKGRCKASHRDEVGCGTAYEVSP